MTQTPDNYLPTFEAIETGFRKGRNVREGYQRGWGIEFGSLREKVKSDRLYVEAMDFIKGRSVVNEDRIINIFLIIKFFLAPYSHGDIIEFGSFKGGSTLFMAYIVDKLYPGMNVYGLDTFDGMPETNNSIDAHTKGNFRDTDYSNLIDIVHRSGLKNVNLVKGLFEETALGVLSKSREIALCHIDCDIYSSVSYSYNIAREYMIPGGYIIFDDATVSSCIGATEAVEELVIQRDNLYSEQVFPHFVFRAKGVKGSYNI